MDRYFLGPCLHLFRGLYADTVTAGLDDNLLPVFLQNYTLFFAAAALFSFPPAMHGVILHTAYCFLQWLLRSHSHQPYMAL